MEHVRLTCKHHTNLRWSCKEIAVSRDGSYNGCRTLFFNGDKDALVTTPKPEGGYVEECDCPSRDLQLAPGESIDFDGPGYSMA